MRGRSDLTAMERYNEELEEAGILLAGDGLHCTERPDMEQIYGARGVRG